ncbi:MAG: hypothetical protein OEW64_00760 [Gammaproteobacteria bacterium]|nr:hypothetical protein [Gammaproteobacteria bacterium]MDH5302609.1 hypothetical protein [Gammaproteobacteria bacterium]MDH5322122.1 hypothetical protein [Gammaproteobacteria bacterium]
MTFDPLQQAILVSLKPMFERAEREQLWFFHHSRDGEEIWCSPPYLRLEQSRGRLIMSPEHWELRNPVGYLKKLIASAKAIVDEYNQLAGQLGYEETLSLESHSTNPADAR